MKIKVTWEATDIRTSLIVLDCTGSRCIVVSRGDNAPWALVRMADGWLTRDFDLGDLIAYLNDNQYRPEWVLKCS